MARDLSWDILLGEHEEDIKDLDDRILRVSSEEEIVREKIIEWNGNLYGFTFRVDTSGRILECGSLYPVRAYEKFVIDYQRFD